MWKDKQGLEATYGNLLELFKTAGHSRCAEVLCEVLRKKKIPSCRKSTLMRTLFDIHIVIAGCVLIIAIVIGLLFL